MYFGEQKHSTFRRPDPEKEQLAEQNRLLKKLLMQQQAQSKKQSQGQPSWRLLSALPRPLIVTVMLFVIVAGMFSYHLLTAPKKYRISDTSAFPAVMAQQITNFKFYYFKPSFQTDYSLARDSVGFRSGVLVFQMTSPSGNTLAFSEEATPPGYGVSSLKADRQYSNAYGQVFITDAALRTTGALFTHDGTWVLVNTPKPIGADQMQQILDALVPQKS